MRGPQQKQKDKMVQDVIFAFCCLNMRMLPNTSTQLEPKNKFRWKPCASVSSLSPLLVLPCYPMSSHVQSLQPFPVFHDNRSPRFAVWHPWTLESSFLHGSAGLMLENRTFFWEGPIPIGPQDPCTVYLPGPYYIFQTFNYLNFMINLGQYNQMDLMGLVLNQHPVFQTCPVAT